MKQGVHAIKPVFYKQEINITSNSI